MCNTDPLLFFQYSSDNVNFVHNYSTDPQWAVQTPVTRLNIMRREASSSIKMPFLLPYTGWFVSQVEAFPGQVFDFPVVGFDELNTVTYVGASVSDNSNEVHVH